jgi:ferritin
VVRGLEAKLNIITAALIGRDDDLAKHWPRLLTRVADAAKARNEIAHASPVTRGGTIRIVLDREQKKTVSVERTEKDRMELRKRTKNGETTRLLDDLFDEYHRTEKLFGNLIGFVKLLRGEVPAVHLLDGLAS